MSKGETSADPPSIFRARAGARARNRNRIYSFLPTLALIFSSLQTACAPPASTTPSSIQIIGRRGSAPASFSHPRGIEVAPDGTIAVTDKTGRLQLFAPDGAHIREWLFPRIDNGTPTGLIFDFADPTSPTLIVPDTHNSRILRYSLAGQIARQFGEYGETPGKMIYPTDIALDPEGNLYITEYGTHDRVMVFSHDGKFLREFGHFGTDPSGFQRPMALAYDATNNRLVVADTCNHRLQLFNLNGDLLSIWGEVGDAPGQFSYPYDVAIDANGDLYVMEYGNNRLQVLDKEGNVKAIYGGPGSEPGQFAGPWGVALTPEGTAVIADTNNHRVQIIKKETILAAKPASSAQVQFQKMRME